MAAELLPNGMRGFWAEPWLPVATVLLGKDIRCWLLSLDEGVPPPGESMGTTMAYGCLGVVGLFTWLEGGFGGVFSAYPKLAEAAGGGAPMFGLCWV